VGRAIGTSAGAALRHITGPGCPAANRARSLEAVDRAGGTGARAGLGYITGPGCPAANRAGGLKAIGWAGGAGARAELGHVTGGPRRGATDRVHRLELTGGRATDARLPVIGSQVALLGALHQAIATDRHRYQFADHAVALAQDVEFAIATHGQADVGAAAAVGNPLRIIAAGNDGAARQH